MVLKALDARGHWKDTNTVIILCASMHADTLISEKNYPRRVIAFPIDCTVKHSYYSESRDWGSLLSPLSSPLKCCAVADEVQTEKYTGKVLLTSIQSNIKLVMIAE